MSLAHQKTKWLCGVALAALLGLPSMGCITEVKGGSDGLSADGVTAVDPVDPVDPAAGCVPKPPNPTDPTDPSGCTTSVLGDGMTCIDPGALKLQAHESCAAMGEVLTELWPLQDCADGGSRTAKYTCCPSPPPPDPGVCTGNILGDGTACIDPTTLKQQAYDACAATGSVLTELWPLQDCPDGGSTQAKYTCCEASPPPPPSPPPPDPGVCTGNLLGDGTTCIDPISVKQQAYDACMATGGTLTELWPLQDCPDGGSTQAKYTCCLPPPSP